MPALPSVPHVLSVKRIHTIGEDLNAVVRNYYSYSGTAPTVTELDTFCAAIATAWGTDMKSLFGTGVELTGVTATDLTSATAAEGESVASIVGTRSGGNLPADVCVVLSNQIARRYRGGHPRAYEPMGTDTDLLDAQTWTTAFLTAVSTGIAAFGAGITAAVWSGGGSLTSVNVSFYEGFTVHTGVTGRARNVSTPRATALVDTVTGQVVRGGIGTQRRRLLRKA